MRRRRRQERALRIRPGSLLTAMLLATVLTVVGVRFGVLRDARGQLVTALAERELRVERLERRVRELGEGRSRLEAAFVERRTRGDALEGRIDSLDHAIQSFAEDPDARERRETLVVLRDELGEASSWLDALSSRLDELSSRAPANQLPVSGVRLHGYPPVSQGLETTFIDVPEDPTVPIEFLGGLRLLREPDESESQVIRLDLEPDEELAP